jgi:hypothetical protein
MEVGFPADVDLKHNEQLRSLTIEIVQSCVTQLESPNVLRGIPLIISKIPTQVTEIVFKGVSDRLGTSEDWLGITNALNHVQSRHLTKIHFCSLDNPHEEILKIRLRNQMVWADARGILDFR